MTRIFAVLVLAGAVASSVFGSAAALGGVNGLGSPSLGANDADVTACDTDGATVSFGTTFDSGNYKVTSVTVSDLDAACNGKTINVTLTVGGSASGTVASGSVSSGSSGSLAVTAGPTAEDLSDVHVVIS